MNQYCRYCSHMCCGDGNWCEVKQKCFIDSTLKSKNNCPFFEFNEIDALGLGKEYQPRNKETWHERLSLLEIDEIVTRRENYERMKLNGKRKDSKSDY